MRMPLFFCQAPADQRLPQFLRGDEELRLRHAHPELADWTLRLPGLRPRLALRSGRGAEELRLHLDTVIVDSDALTLTLLWRGLIGVASRDASDLRRLALVVEELAAPARPGSAICALLELPSPPAPAAEPAQPPAPLPVRQPPPLSAVAPDGVWDRLRLDAHLARGGEAHAAQHVIHALYRAPLPVNFHLPAGIGHFAQDQQGRLGRFGFDFQTVVATREQTRLAGGGGRRLRPHGCE